MILRDACAWEDPYLAILEALVDSLLSASLVELVLDFLQKLEPPLIVRRSMANTSGEAVFSEAKKVFPYRRFRRDLVSVIGNCLHGRKQFQDEIKKKKDKKGVETILKVADKIGLKIIETSKHDLNMAVNNWPHQSLMLNASPLEIVDIRELEPIAEKGVVLCTKNSTPLSGVVGEASAGSLELIELRSCKNMMKFLTSSMENGWRVLGGSVSSKALTLREVEGGLPTILVLGSEGRGLRPLVDRSCTQLVRIPRSMTVDSVSGDTRVGGEDMAQNCFGQELNFFLSVESLNVNVAAGVLLYHFVGDTKHFSMEKMNRISS
ncbi:hypothetical protein IEQ34_010342 [Dendrobium chrysotoxum]|uniref:tRNA/rRNA methyltransferase SpoU type domain-containing protein n=1 Tax=Dendrobium chrysotoxum TaxID=161865 RepID=A0AAV7H4H5_DENCH|nr:hypothetical protein IEQ34_010342 [Dendrobium chrysotoxum]